MSSKHSVLVVDDSRVSRMMTRQFIHNKCPDWPVLEAGTGEEALQKLSAQPLSLVIMDVNMPGMGGIAAAEQIRAQFPSLKLALQTANIQDATREKAAALGASFLEKPISEVRLHRLLEELQGAG